MFFAFFFFCDGLVVVVQGLEEHERGHLGKNLGVAKTKANKVPLCTPTHDSVFLFFLFLSRLFFFWGGAGGDWNGSFTGEGLRRSEGVLGCSSFSRFGFGSFFVPISAIANF